MFNFIVERAPITFGSVPDWYLDKDNNLHISDGVLAVRIEAEGLVVQRGHANHAGDYDLHCTDLTGKTLRIEMKG